MLDSLSHHILSTYCSSHLLPSFFLLFFFNDPATTEIYTLSLHDALPILRPRFLCALFSQDTLIQYYCRALARADRKSTRLNSSHITISYAVFCLKKKKIKDKANSVKNRDMQDMRASKEMTPFAADAC